MVSGTSSEGWRDQIRTAKEQGQSELSALQAIVARTNERLLSDSSQTPAGLGAVTTPAAAATVAEPQRSSKPVAVADKWQRIAHWVSNDSRAATGVEDMESAPPVDPTSELSQSESLSLDSILDKLPSRATQGAAGAQLLRDGHGGMIASVTNHNRQGFHPEGILSAVVAGDASAAVAPVLADWRKQTSASHLAQVAVLQGKLEAAEEELRLAKRHAGQDMERAQQLFAAEQQQSAHKLAAVEEALAIERELNQHLKKQLRDGEERIRDVIETEQRARQSEAATLQQMYAHAVQALEAERQRAAETVAAAMQDANNEHGSRLLKLEQERSAAIATLEEENAQLRVRLSNQLTETQGLQESLVQKVSQFDTLESTLQQEVMGAQENIATLQAQLARSQSKEQEAHSQLEQAYYEVAKMRDELQMLTSRLSARDKALVEQMQEMERQQNEIHNVEMAAATEAYTLLKETIIAIHGSLKPALLADVFAVSAVQARDMSWSPEITPLIEALCSDHEAYAELEQRLISNDAAQPEDARAVLNRVQEVLHCAQLTLAAMDSEGRSLAVSSKQLQAETQAVILDLQHQLSAQQEANAKLVQHAGGLEEATTRLEDITEQLEAAQAQIADLQGQLHHVAASAGGNEQENHRLAATCSSLQAEADALRVEMQQTASSAEQLVVELQLWQQRGEEAEAQVAELEGRLACSNDALTQMEHLAKTKEERIKELRRALNRAMDGQSDDVQQLKTHLDQHTKMYSELQTEFNLVSERRTELDQAIKLADEQVKHWQHKASEYEAVVEQLQSQIHLAEEAASSCRQELLHLGILLGDQLEAGERSVSTYHVLASQLQIELSKSNDKLDIISALRVCKLSAQAQVAWIKHTAKAEASTQQLIAQVQQELTITLAKAKDLLTVVLPSLPDQNTAKFLSQPPQLKLQHLDSLITLCPVSAFLGEVLSCTRQEYEQLRSEHQKLSHNIGKATADQESAAAKLKLAQEQAAAYSQQVQEVKTVAQQQWTKLHGEVSALLKAAEGARQAAEDEAVRTKAHAEQRLKDADARISELDMQCQSLQQQESELHVHLTEVQNKLQLLQSKEQELQIRLQKAEQISLDSLTQLATATAKAEDLQQHWSNSQADLAVVQAELSHLRSRADPVFMKVHHLEHQLQAAKVRKSSAVKQMVVARRWRHRSDKQAEARKATATALQAKLGSALADAQRHSTAAADFEARATRAEQLAAKLDERRAALEADKRKLQERLARMQEQLGLKDKMAHELQAAMSKAATFKDQAGAKDAMVQTLLQQLEQAEHALRSSQEVAGQLIKENEALSLQTGCLQTQLDALQQDLASVSTQHAGLDQQLQQLLAVAARQGLQATQDGPVVGAWEAMVADLYAPGQPLLDVLQQMSTDEHLQAPVRKVSAHLVDLLLELQEQTAAKVAAAEQRDALVKELEALKEDTKHISTDAKNERIQELRAALSSSMKECQELRDTVEALRTQLSMQSRLGTSDADKLHMADVQLGELRHELQVAKEAQAAATQGMEELAHRLQDAQHIADTRDQEVKKLQEQLHLDTFDLLHQLHELKQQAELSRGELQALQTLISQQDNDLQPQALQEELLASAAREAAIKQAWEESEAEQAAALERMEAAWVEQEQQLHALIGQLQEQVVQLTHEQHPAAEQQLIEEHNAMQQLADELRAVKESMRTDVQDRAAVESQLEKLARQHQAEQQRLLKDLSHLQEDLQQAEHLLRSKELECSQLTSRLQEREDDLQGVLAADLQQVQATAAAATADLQAARQLCLALDAQVQELDRKVQLQSAANIELQQQLQTSQATLHSVQIELHQQEEKLDLEKARAAAVLQELNGCQDANSQLHAALKAAQDEINHLSAECRVLHSKQQQVDDLQARCSELQDQLLQAMGQVSSSSELGMQLMQLQGELQSKKSTLADYEQLVIRQQSVMDELRQENEALKVGQAAAKDASTTASQFTAQLQAQKHYTEQLEAALKAASSAPVSQDANSGVAHHEQLVQQLQVQLTLLQSEVADLKGLLQQKEQEYHAQLQAIQGSHNEAAVSSNLQSLQATQLSTVVAENQDLVQRLSATHARLNALKAQLMAKDAEVAQKDAKVKQLQACLRAVLPASATGLSSHSQASSPRGSVASGWSTSAPPADNRDGCPGGLDLDDLEWAGDLEPSTIISSTEAIQLRAECQAYKEGMAAARQEAAASSAAAAEAQARVAQLQRMLDDLRQAHVTEQAVFIQAAADSGSDPTANLPQASYGQLQSLQQKVEQLSTALQEMNSAYTAVCHTRDDWQTQATAAHSQLRQLDLELQQYRQNAKATQAALESKQALIRQLTEALEPRPQHVARSESEATSATSQDPASASSSFKLEAIITMWKESCRMKDVQISDLECDLRLAHELLDSTRADVKELQQRCLEGDAKLSSLLRGEKLARQDVEGQLSAASMQVSAAEARLAAADAELQASKSRATALERQLESLSDQLQAARDDAHVASSASTQAAGRLKEAESQAAAHRDTAEALRRQLQVVDARAADAARQLQSKDQDVLLLCESVRDVLVGVRSTYSHPFDWSLEGAEQGSPLQHLRQLVDVLAAEVANRQSQQDRASSEVGQLSAVLKEKQALLDEQDLKLRAQTDKIFQQQAQLQQKARDLERAQAGARQREQDWEHVEKELLSLRRECDSLRDRLVSQQQQHASSSGEAQHLLLHNEQLQAQLAAKVEECSAALSRLHAVQRQLQVQHSTQAVLQERLDALETQLSAAQDAEARATMASQEAVAHQELAQSELESARMQLAFKEESLQKRMHEVREMNSMLKAWEAMRLGKDAQISALMERSKRQEEEFEEKSRLVESLKRRLAAVMGRQTSGGDSTTGGPGSKVAQGTSSNGASHLQSGPQRFLHLHVHGSPQHSAAASVRSVSSQPPFREL